MNMHTFKLSKEFWQRYNIAISCVPEILDLFQKTLHNKNLKPLRHLAWLVESYDVAIRIQAKKDFLERVGADSFSDYIQNDEYTGIDPNERSKAKRKIEYSSRTRTKNGAFNEKARNLNLEALRHLRPRSDKKTLSIDEDIEKNFLPRFYTSIRKELAGKSLEQARVSLDSVITAQEEMFAEIIFILNQDRPGALSKNERNLVRSLENCILIDFPILFRDLGIRSKTSLLSLRTSCTSKWNAVCVHCCKKLHKNNTHRSCSRTNNRKCYEKRLRELKRSEKTPWEQGQFDPPKICKYCGKFATKIYKHSKRKVCFCSKRCYDTLRKKEQREKAMTA